MSSVQPVVAPSREHVSGAGVVLQTLALTKTYRMGEVDVHALRGVDLVLHEVARRRARGPVPNRQRP